MIARLSVNIDLIIHLIFFLSLSFLDRYQIENDLSSFIETSRRQRDQSLMAKTTRATSLYLPSTNYGTQSETNFYPRSSEDPMLNSKALRSLSPEDVQKMKYKIDLGTSEVRVFGTIQFGFSSR